MNFVDSSPSSQYLESEYTVDEEIFIIGWIQGAGDLHENPRFRTICP
jgi:hypothetical protein